MRPLLQILLTSLTLVLLSSCEGDRTVDKATQEKILLIGNSDEPADLDPQVVTGVIESNIITG